MAVNFDDLIPKQGNQGISFDDLIPQKNFGQRVSEDLQKRRSMVDEIRAAERAGEIGALQKGYQIAGKGSIGLLIDIIGEGSVSAGRGLSNITHDIIKDPIKKAALYGANIVSDSFAGDLARKASTEYQDFSQRNPNKARNIEATLNLGGVLAAFTPVGAGKTLASTAVSTAGRAGQEGAKLLGGALKATAKAPINATIGTVKLGNTILEKVGQKASEAVVKSNLPNELKNLPKAEALFLRELKNEGITPQDAYSALLESKKLGVSPSIAAVSNIPSLKNKGFLMAEGSQGSKVAAKAIEDIEMIQIPKLNEEIIKKATGASQTLSAEKYGQEIAGMAKKAIDDQKLKLSQRASPYYQAAIGVDKSIDIQNPLMQKALSNPLVAKSLDDWRVDPYTLTNVQKELSGFGVDSTDINKLPYNSTVTLHAARTHLRSLKDSAFSSGEKQKVAAIKSALDDIDNAIESQYPSYKTARKIYSEDAGALKSLNDSPLGVMAKFGEGDFSKIANNLMNKDPEFINKFFAKVKTAGGDETKMRNSIAGAYLQRKLEDSAKEGLRFSDAVLKNQTVRKQLKAVVGDEKFDKIESINKVIDDLNETRKMTQGSRTSAVQSIRDEVSPFEIPTSKGELFMALKGKYAPSLIDMVKNDPQSAARFNELLFTDEGFKFLESMQGTSKLTVGDQNRLSKFLSSKKKVK